MIARRDQEPFQGFRSIFEDVKQEAQDHLLRYKPNPNLGLSRRRNSAKKAMKAASGGEEIGDDEVDALENHLKDRRDRGLTPAGTRKRLRWTDAEDEILASCYVDMETRPSLIASSSLPDRTPTDCENRIKSVRKSNKLSRDWTSVQVAEWMLENKKK